MGTGYTYRLDEAERQRFAAMAANAERHESALWARAGILPGATVLDLGCGPGALLPALAERVGPSGSVVALDADPAAADAARRLANRLPAQATVIQADAAASGLPGASLDTIVCRNVLVHNGRRAGELLAHGAGLLRPGGRLLSVEPDVESIDFGDAAEEREYELRWAAMARADGNDPALGRGERLADLLRAHRWDVLDTLAWSDVLWVDRSPAWAAAEAVERRGFATAAELADWRAALERRRATGALRCTLAMTAVLARPNAR